jgi:hypothetical protein
LSEEASSARTSAGAAAVKKHAKIKDKRRMMHPQQTMERPGNQAIGYGKKADEAICRRGELRQASNQ